MYKRQVEGWEDLLPLILKPRNFTGMTALFEDDSLLFTNIVTGEEDAAFCGEEDDILKVMPMSPVSYTHLSMMDMTKLTGKLYLVSHLLP